MTIAPPEELLRFSQNAIARGSQSFAKAAMLFDRKTRMSVILLYAWCRHCDDVIDGQILGHGQQQATPDTLKARVARLRASTQAALAGETTDDPAFAALAYVAHRHAISERHALALIEGFAMDASLMRYATLDALMLYCYRVAGVVGVMMAQIMGVRDPATFKRATDLGLAFQLTNIARDIVDDARAGRIYLPFEWLDEQGLPHDPAALLQKPYRPALHALAVRLVGEAQPYYHSARLGITQLPYRSAWAIATARSIYRDIGLRVARGGPNVWEQRVRTTRAGKLWRVGQGSMTAAFAQCFRYAPQAPRIGLWTYNEEMV